MAKVGCVQNSCVGGCSKSVMGDVCMLVVVNVCCGSRFLIQTCGCKCMQAGDPLVLYASASWGGPSGVGL